MHIHPKSSEPSTQQQILAAAAMVQPPMPLQPQPMFNPAETPAATVSFSAQAAELAQAEAGDGPSL
jgi:hypothetical protein